MTNYKIICKMADGSHKILRGAVDVVAHFVTAVKKAQQSSSDFKQYDNSLCMNMDDVASARIINEYTQELFLAL